ncbi:hypothetical protein ACP4OV_019514 [Aristida adscensionis]
MAHRGVTSGGNSSKSDDTSETSLTNKLEESHATDGAGALETNEVESSILINNSGSLKDIPSQNSPRAKRSRQHRVIGKQSQVLEGFFGVCAHPSEEQRKELSKTTGLREDQNLSRKEENYRLKVENEILRDENIRLKKAQGNIVCPRCSNEPGRAQVFSETQKLRMQNDWMEQEIARVGAAIPLNPNTRKRAFQPEPSSEHASVMPDSVEVLADIAKVAMHEFVTLVDSNGPMWQPVPGGALETLNKVAYTQTFPCMSTADSTGLNREGTRASAVVMMDAKNIVDFLMDAGSYGTFFPGLMSRAAVAKVYNWPADRKAGYDGAMLLVTIEVVFPSPLVPARKCSFLRCCKYLENGAIAVADVSLDDGKGTILKCRKMPSGLLIQPIRHNSCKVTVVEHVLVDDSGVHEFFQPCLPGLLFGARRWVMSMARQCARIRDVFHVTSSSLQFTSRGKKMMMTLADKLLCDYAAGVTAIPAGAWTLQCGAGTRDDVKIIFKRSDDGSNTAVVCASTSFLVPVPMRRAYHLLSTNMLRGKWDILVHGGSVKEEARVANGVGTEDAVSILHVKHGVGPKKEILMILQNSCYDASGSFMVYSSLEKEMMDRTMSLGDDPNIGNVTLFPSGFFLAPIPDANAKQGDATIGEAGGTLVTSGFQILMKLARGTGLSSRSVSSAIKIIKEQIAGVEDMLINSHPVFYKNLSPSTT